MNILHISTYEAGGAGRAACRLHCGLLLSETRSRVLVRHRKDTDTNVLAFTPRWSNWRRFQGLMRAKYVKYYSKKNLKNGVTESFTDSRSRFKAAFVDNLPDCDVINLHWVSDDFLDYDGFFNSVPVDIPVVWTLHDMNPFTGGCHYDSECGRFSLSCGECPLLGTTGSNDLSNKIWRRKHRAFERAIKRGVKIHIVSPSRWLADCAKKSSLFNQFSVSVIPNGLNAEIFKPFDSAGFREAFGISSAQRILFFSSARITDKRKGFELLIKALRLLPLERLNIHLICAGWGSQLDGLKDVPISFLGDISNDRLLALAYSAADLFVISSLQDNLPNTVLEAMACGTPVVGFDVGGIPDMVRPGKTGLLAQAGDPHSLARAIQSILEDDNLGESMANESRATVLREYTLEAQAKAYINLYESLVDHNHAKSFNLPANQYV